MKQILHMRHTKSSWDDDSLPDHLRPLRGRGKREAPRIGKFVQEEGLVVDALLHGSRR